MNILNWWNAPLNETHMIAMFLVMILAFGALGKFAETSLGEKFFNVVERALVRVGS
jgi:hypothetical protein